MRGLAVSRPHPPRNRAPRYPGTTILSFSAHNPNRTGVVVTGSPSVLRDPWGHPYKYLPQPQRYLVIGFTPDDKPDTDLFLSHAVDAGPTAAASKPVTGGIQLVE